MNQNPLLFHYFSPLLPNIPGIQYLHGKLSNENIIHILSFIYPFEYIHHISLSKIKNITWNYKHTNIHTFTISDSSEDLLLICKNNKKYISNSLSIYDYFIHPHTIFQNIHTLELFTSYPLTIPPHSIPSSVKHIILHNQELSFITFPDSVLHLSFYKDFNFGHLSKNVLPKYLISISFIDCYPHFISNDSFPSSLLYLSFLCFQIHPQFIPSYSIHQPISIFIQSF